MPTHPTFAPSGGGAAAAAESPNPRVRSTSVPLAGATAIPALVAQCYDAAPAPERCRLIEQLLRPLGLLSLAAVAGGVFAQVRLRNGWPELKVRIDDLQGIGSEHVMALVDHAQQVSVETVDGLARLLAASPAWSGSATAAMLVTLLMQRKRARSAPPSPAPRRGFASGDAAFAPPSARAGD